MCFLFFRNNLLPQYSWQLFKILFVRTSAQPKNILQNRAPATMFLISCGFKLALSLCSPSSFRPGCLLPLRVTSARNTRSFSPQALRGKRDSSSVRLQADKTRQEKRLSGDYTWIPFSPNVLAFFLNYLQEVSLNPKIISQDHNASSHKSERIFTIFKLSVKKEKGEEKLMNFKKIENC